MAGHGWFLFVAESYADDLPYWEAVAGLPELFVPFLQSLPAGTTIELRGELAAFQNAQVAGRIRLEATESETDWFDLRVLVDVNDATLTPEEIKLLLEPERDGFGHEIGPVAGSGMKCDFEQTLMAAPDGGRSFSD